MADSQYKNVENLRLTFSKCAIGQNVNLADSFGGSSIRDLRITDCSRLNFGGSEQNSGLKIKSVKNFYVSGCEVRDFNWISQSIESRHVNEFKLHDINVSSFSVIF